MMPQTALQRHLLGSSLKNLTGEVKKTNKKMSVVMHLEFYAIFFLAKIANSWLKRPPKFTTITRLSFGATGAGNSDMTYL